jgi:hypothetical protein
VVFGPAAEQIGLTSILLLVVYGGFGLSSGEAAAQAGGIVVGGLFQTALSVVAWPFRQFGPERNALAAVFRQLAAYTRAPTQPDQAPPVTTEITTAGTTLTGVGRALSATAEALRIVLDEAERIRLELMALLRLRADLLDEHRDAVIRASFDGLWTAAGELLDRLAAAMEGGAAVVGGAELLQRAERSVKTMREAVAGPGRGDPVLNHTLRCRALGGEATLHVVMLAGDRLKNVPEPHV